MRGWLALSAAASLISAATVRAQTATTSGGLRPFDFRGHRMGDTLWAVFGTCVGVGQALTRGEEQTTIGVTKVHAHYAFSSNHFSGMELTFAPEQYAAMVAALAQKFGPPDTTWTEPVHNAMGAEYTNEIVAWRTDGGLLHAKKYGDRVDVSLVRIMNQAGEAAEKAAADSAARRASKDL